MQYDIMSILNHCRLNSDRKNSVNAKYTIFIVLLIFNLCAVSFIIAVLVGLWVVYYKKHRRDMMVEMLSFVSFRKFLYISLILYS